MLKSGPEFFSFSHSYPSPRLPWWLSCNLPAMQEMLETQVWSLGWENPLEEEMSIHSRNPAWKMPWIEEPGGLQSMGSQRVGHDWVTEHTPPQPPPSIPRLHSTTSLNWSSFFFFFPNCYNCINSWSIYHELYLILNFFGHDINLFLTFQGLEGTGNKIIAERRVHFEFTSPVSKLTQPAATVFHSC